MSHSILGKYRPLLLCVCVFMAFAGISPTVHAADKPDSQKISRVIAKEITAAQKAMQANQWSEALKNLEVAETKSPLSTYDKKSIAEFKGICYVRLNNLKAAQTAYEQAVEPVATRRRSCRRRTVCCSNWPRPTNKTPRRLNTANRPPTQVQPPPMTC